MSTMVLLKATLAEILLTIDTDAGDIGGALGIGDALLFVLEPLVSAIDANLLFPTYNCIFMFLGVAEESFFR